MVSLDALRETLGCRDGETVYEAAERVVRRNRELEVTLKRIQAEFSQTEMGRLRAYILEKIGETPDNEYGIGEQNTLGWLAVELESIDERVWKAYAHGWSRGSSGLPLRGDEATKTADS